MQNSKSLSITPEMFREATGSFATGVTIVTTRTAQGEPVGITANSFTSVSLDPPLVLFGIARRAFSAPLFEKADGYAINILTAAQFPLANRFARAGTDKWNGVAFTPGIDGCPLIDGALSCIECRPYATYDGGDHLIMVGRTVRISRGSDCAPLLFYRRSFRGVGSPLA